MDDQPDGGAERPGPDAAGPAGLGPEFAGAPTEPGLDVVSTRPVRGLGDGPAAQALAEEAAEINRLIEAGAGSPEAIRELAARLRQHRAREEALWRAEVRPVLKKEGKGRLRGHAKPVAETTAGAGATVESGPGQPSQSLWLGLALLGLVLVVVVAANTTVWVLLVPVLVLLGWAWNQGRDGG